ncbi:MAG: hypothetical protein GY757_32500 [bacterium]|nr:hypothetical protein [bacterium]
MTNKKSLNKEVDDAMNYIERMETIELDDYFDIRLEARIRELQRGEQAGWREYALSLLRPALITLLLVVNLISFIYFTATPTTGTKATVTTGSSYVNALVSTYSPDQNSYDLTLMKNMKRTAGGG